MAPLSRRTYFPFYSIRGYTWLQSRSSFPDDGFSGLESHTVAGMVRRYRFVIEIYHHPHYLSFILYFFWGGECHAQCGTIALAPAIALAVLVG